MSLLTATSRWLASASSSSLKPVRGGTPLIGSLSTLWALPLPLSTLPTECTGESVWILGVRVRVPLRLPGSTGSAGASALTPPAHRRGE